MNSKLRLVIILLAIVAIAVVLIRIFSPEDDWICQGGQWVKHGNPSTEMPNQTCLK